MEYVITWFYSENSSEYGIYPQVHGESSSQNFQIVYKKCILTFFTSAVHANQGSKFLLYTNKMESEIFKTKTERRILRKIKALGVEIRTINYTFKPPEKQRLWRNQFFILDILSDLSSKLENDDLVAILDSDVVWSGSPNTTNFWNELKIIGSLNMQPIASRDENINGYSQNQLHFLANIFNLECSDCIEYCGGEFITFNYNFLNQCVEMSKVLFPKYIKELALSNIDFIEEAHFLSLIFDTWNVPTGVGNKYIRRIWTNDWKYTNREEHDETLVMWHLPAEKKYGLKRLADVLLLSPKLFWPKYRSFPWRILLYFAGVKKNIFKTFLDLFTKLFQKGNVDA